MSTPITNTSWGWLIGITTSLRLGWMAEISSVAIAAVLVASTVAEAGQLTQWQYDETTHQLELTLSETTTPRYFLLAQPARIVVDLPNTQLGAVPAEQMLSGSVRSVRVSQFQPDMARIVIELSPDAVLAAPQVEMQQASDLAWSIRPVFVGAAPSSPVAIAPDPSTEPFQSEPFQDDLGLSPPDEALPTISEPAHASEATTLADAIPEAVGEADAEDSTLPPLEPGAIELAITPPDASAPGPDSSSDSSVDASPALEVPSLHTAIAEMGLDQIPGFAQRPENQLPSESRSGSVRVEVTDVTPTSIEHRFDPTAPVLDATIPTEINPPVLDGTRPAAVVLVPPSALATSPQDALAQVRDSSREETVVPIPVTVPAPDQAVPETGVQSEQASAQAANSELHQPEVELAEAPTDIEEGDERSVGNPENEDSEPEASLSSADDGDLAPASTRVLAPPPNAATLSETTDPSSLIAFGQPIVDRASEAASIPIPAGTTVNLRYPGEEPLVLNPGTRQDVLLLQHPLQDDQGNIIAEAGSPVIGRFETSDAGSKFVIQAIAIQSQNIRVTGESQPIDVSETEAPDASSSASATFDPALLFSGAATSVAMRMQPDAVVIQPNQIITVQITDSLASR